MSFKGKCPECGGTEFEMIAGIRVSAKYDVKFTGNKLVDYEFFDFGEVDSDDTDYIYKDSETIYCCKCNHTIEEDVNLSYINFI